MFLDGCCRPISMHEVWRDLGLRHLRVEHISSFRQEVYMRWAIVVPGKYGMAPLMLALREAEIKAETIPVHMHHGNTETQQLKDNNKTPTVMVNLVHINKTTTLTLPTEEVWIQAISEDHDIGYIKIILSIPEETPIDPKELRNKRSVKPFSARTSRSRQ